MKNMNKQTKDAAAICLIIGIGFVIASALSGCGKGENGAPGPAGPAGAVTPATSSSETTIQLMVDNENQYRSSVGQAPLTPGLVCSLYTVPTTTTAIIGATGLVGIGSWSYNGVFNQPNGPVTAGLNILPQGLQGVYQTWYIVKCTGNLVISDDNWHQFDLNSDDGSNLYIDGLLVSNDGLHGAQTKSASKFLKYGFHSFELDFFQGAGSQSLILNEDGALMQSTGFYH